MQEKEQYAGETSILKLPNEILLTIFSYFPSVLSADSPDPHTPRFTLVCKRWSLLYEPSLFHHINLTTPRIEERIRGFLTILETRPQLQKHVRRLSVGMRLVRLYGKAWCEVAKIVECCKALEWVNIGLPMTSESVPLICALRDLSSLQTLILKHTSIYAILQLLDLPSLKTALLDNYGPGQTKTDLGSGPSRESYPISHDDLDELLPPSRYHTSNVTQLILQPKSSALVTERIVRLPAHLQTLSIRFGPFSSWTRYHPAEVQRILSIHCRTLKFISISQFGGMLDFSHFSCLEELHIDARDVLISESPYSTLEKIATPSLRCIYISFGYILPKSLSRTDFGVEHYKWVEKFASLRQLHFPDSGLRELEIKIFTGEMEEAALAGDPSAWPWEFLEMARETASKYDLEFIYEAPRWTKGRWNEILRENGVDPETLPPVGHDLKDSN